MAWLSRLLGGILCLVLTGVVSALPAGGAAEEVVIVAGGDVLLDRGVRSAPGFAGDGRELFKFIQPVLADADIAFANLECPLASECYCLPKAYCLRGDPEKAQGLSAAGFDLLTLANNHVYDCGREAISSTVSVLTACGVQVAGAGADLAAASRPAVFNIRGVKVAIAAFTQFPLEGLCWDPARPTPALCSCAEMAERVKRIRKDVDLLIVSIHWGLEYSPLPSESQLATANALVEAGADVIVGHHPHVVQPCEKIGSHWVAYSLGNLVFDSRRPEARLAALIVVRFNNKTRALTVRFLPLEIRQDRPEPAAAPEELKIVRSLNGLAEAQAWMADGGLIAHAGETRVSSGKGAP
ncbi:MAG: CapA family protein [Candidatus Aminicenantes bacterium]|nr:CapA family protein [Candidatus Aminicenantes bacterium]